jgi:hypothetical protein
LEIERVIPEPLLRVALVSIVIFLVAVVFLFILFFFVFVNPVVLFRIIASFGNLCSCLYG